MFSRKLGALALVIIFAAAALSSVAVAQQSSPTSSSTPTAIPTRIGGVRPNTFSGTVSGIASYAAGSDQGTSFNLPLVRIDSTYDTIIHVVNASATPAIVVIDLYDQSGNLQWIYNSPTLNSWASLDYDVQADPGATQVFQKGSATVASRAIGGGSPGPIVVQAEVLNSVDADNVDSYGEVPGSSTASSSGGNVTYLPLLPSCANGQNCNGATDTPTLYLHNNDSARPANANLSFYWTNPPSGQPSPTPVTDTVSQIPPNGEKDIAVNTINGIFQFNFDAATRIESDRPLAVAMDEEGNRLGFWSAAPTPSNVGSTFYVPRFDYQTPKSTYWTAGLVLLNVASNPQTFTVSVYDPSGRLALQQSLSDVPPMGVGKFNYGGADQNLNLPDGFKGSLVVTSQSSAVVWFAKYLVPVFSESIYFTLTSPPLGTTVVVPSVRKQALDINNSVASTAIAIQNPTALAQTYTLSFRDMDGNLVYSENISFPPHAMWYVSQETDPRLPDRFTGSAEIVNASGGPLPIVAADVDAGAYRPSPTLPFPNEVFLPLVSASSN